MSDKPFSEAELRYLAEHLPDHVETAPDGTLRATMTRSEIWSMSRRYPSHYPASVFGDQIPEHESKP